MPHFRINLFRRLKWNDLINARHTVLIFSMCLLPWSFFSQSSHKSDTPAFETRFADSLWKETQKMDSTSRKIAFMLDEYYPVLNKNHTDGIRWVEEALKLAREESNQRLIGRSHLCLGIIWYLNGDYERALTNYQKASRIFEESNDLKYLGRTNNELAVYYRKQKQYDEALKKLDIAYEACLEANDMICLETALNTRGVVHEMQGNYDQAVSYYKQAEEIAWDNQNNLGLSYIYNNLAEVYRIQSEFDSAQQYLDRSINIRKQLKDLQGLAMNYMNQGDLYVRMQDYEKAVVSLKRGLKLAEEVEYADLIKYGHRLLSEAYKGLNQTERALSHLEMSYQLNDSLLNTEKIQALSDMEVKYETEKKEKIIAQKEANLLRQEAKLKERNLWLFIALGIVCIVFLTLGFLLWMYRMKGKQLRQQAKMDLQNERLRISRDLHDNVGAELTLISSSLYSADQKRENEKDYLQQIGSYAKNAINQLRETVWVIQKEKVTLSEFHARISEYGHKICSAAGVQFQPNEVSENPLELSSIQTINLFRACQEAMNNAVKYANCDRVTMEIIQSKDKLDIFITDNGKGFDSEKCSMGRGIDNMRERISELKGTFTISSKEGRGTTVQFTDIPL